MRWQSAFSTPALALLIVFIVVPFATMVWVSMTDMSFAGGISNARYVGFTNYVRALGDEDFWSAVLVTSIFVISSVSLSLLLGTILGASIFEARGLSNSILCLLIIPFLLSPIVIGLSWRLMLHGEFGPISHAIGMIVPTFDNSLLASRATALISVIAIDVWQWTPFVALLVLIHLHTMPKSPTDAALLDGASMSQVRLTIWIPSSIGLLLAITLIRVTDALREFDKINVLTGGGPGTATETLGIYTSRTVFTSWQIGYGAAVCVLIYLAAIALCFLIIRFAVRKKSVV